MIEALEAAVAERDRERAWSPDTELAATAAELLSGLLRVTTAVHARRGANLPPAIRIPRPEHLETHRRAPRLSPREFAMRYAPRAGP